MAKSQRGHSTSGSRRTWHGADVEHAVLLDFRHYQTKRRLREYALYVFVWLVASVLFWAGLTAWERVGVERPLAIADQAALPRQSADRVRASFGLCHSGGGTNCVVDGDTFWFDGERIRVADIDAPETHPPRCAEEAELGDQATARLHQLMNSGAFSLERIDRDTDRYGRKLRIIVRDGESLGDTLVAEGLARPYNGGRRPWCPV